MTRYGGIGGIISGREREKADEFENAVDRAMGKRLRDGDRNLGRRLWGSLANITWTHENGDIAEYTFRAAGDLIAAIVSEGDYLDWYCQSESGVVDEEVARLMAEQGWAGEP